MTSLPSAERVTALRAELWDAGYKPIALYSWNLARLPQKDRGKRPIGNEWQARARRNPPEAVEAAPEPDAMNTGILCDGLRAVDIDVEDAGVVARVRSLAFARFGETLIRHRLNSPRCLLPYRAMAGEPGKRQIVGKFGKVEVLGRGQQFAAYGRHPSGALLHWMPEGLMQTPRDTLPAVAEDQITAFFRAAIPLIGATVEKAAVGGVRAEDPEQLRTALGALIDAGAENIAMVDDLSGELRAKLAVALATSDRLRRRWAGDVSDLRGSGRDSSRSGQDFSLLALLKRTGFAPAEAAMCLLAFEFGSAHEKTKHPDGRARLRYVARSALRASNQPSNPRRREIARRAFCLLSRGMASAELLAELHWLNEQSSDPLPRDDINATALWAAQRLRKQSDAR